MGRSASVIGVTHDMIRDEEQEEGRQDARTDEESCRRWVGTPLTQHDVKTGGERHWSCSKKHHCTIQAGRRKFRTANGMVEVSVPHQTEGVEMRFGCLQSEQD